MDDESKKKLRAVSDSLAKEMKRFQETMAPAAKVMQKALSSMPKFPQVEISQPSLALPPLPIDQDLASEFHGRLEKWIYDFDQTLDQQHEVGVRLVSFGQTVSFHLENIGYWNPSLLSFSGFMENGDPVELIQHVSQISILLIKVKRKDPTKPKRPIGFASWPEDETDSET